LSVFILLCAGGKTRFVPNAGYPFQLIKLVSAVIETDGHYTGNLIGVV
jgi:hypothetical protein